LRALKKRQGVVGTGVQKLTIQKFLVALAFMSALLEH
jgi:hypothetical protein